MWTPWIPSPAHPIAWAPPAHGARRALIDLLLRVSALLVRTAVRLQRAPLIAPVPKASSAPPFSAPPLQAAASPPSVAAPPAEREFHAEAGAPEGALYVDGRLVGHLIGVTRL